MLDEMHLNIGTIDIGMIPRPDVFHTQDPHSLKIPCRLLVPEERENERKSQLTWQQWNNTLKSEQKVKGKDAENHLHFVFF